MPSIVIARYNENIDWIFDIPRDYKIYLYNKGEKNISQHHMHRVYKYYELENIGRESDTYLLHILINSEDSNSFTVFTQADPFEHCHNFIHLLSHNFSENVWGYSSRWKMGCPPENLIKDYCKKTGKKNRNEIFSVYNWGPLHFYDEGAFYISSLYFSSFGVENGTNIAEDFFNKIGYTAGREKAKSALLGEFSYGAIFGARNEAIRMVPRDVYIKALAIVRANDMAGHIMERLWLHLFGHPFLSFNAENLS